MKFFDRFKRNRKAAFRPPVPDWQPAFEQPLDKVIETFRYYSNKQRDFAIFTHGTIVLLPTGLNGEDAVELAYQSLDQVFCNHPDMQPQLMDDGNIMVMYRNNVANVVLQSVAEKHWQEIDANHQRALATSEVMINPLGENVFDDFGKKALFGRCYMFMDAQAPKLVMIQRASG